MNQPNTLFLLYKHGLKVLNKKGVCESGIWHLSSDEQQMKYLSLHRSKSNRAYKGGKIISIRNAHQDEIAAYYHELNKTVPTSAASTPYQVIKFQMDREWHVLWPEDARKNPMANKGTGHIESKEVAETE